MKTEVYLVLFKNKKTKEEMLVACGDFYDTLAYTFLKYECEYKDLHKGNLEKDWTFEKKVKDIYWD